MNGDNYVTWDYMKEQQDKAIAGLLRLTKLEAEVMGDEETGRLSLRKEFISQNRKTRSAIFCGIAIFILESIVNWMMIKPPHIG